MDLGLSDKCALVLAGGGGLGSGVARALAAEGSRVAVADLSGQRAQSTVESIRQGGGLAAAFQCDLGDRASLEELVRMVREGLGDPDILVNLTGGPPPTKASGVDPEQWEAYFRTMVNGVIYLTDLVLPGMRRKRWGRVITSTSSGVIAPIPDLAMSNALRLCLVGWSKTLAGEVGREGITCNVVVPGRVATQRVIELDALRAQREGQLVEDVVRNSTTAIPVGRYGTVEEYAAVVVFLASAVASYITGSAVRVDGGLLASV